MARQPRIALAGRPHLIVQSTAAGSPAFIDDDDRRLYLGLLHDCARSAGVSIQAHALAECRTQILATPESAESLARFMQRLGRRYVTAFNRRHHTVGALWACRFGSAALLSEQYLLRAVLMIEQLPIREGCAPSASEWPWSSAAHHLGSRPDSRLVDPACYWALGNTPFERQARYAELLRTLLPESQVGELQRAATKGWPLGDASALELLQKSLPHQLLRPRPRGRPRNPK